MIYTIVILDGWHAGYVIRGLEPLPEIKIPVPPHIVICDCGEFPEEHSMEKGYKTYKVAFRSIEGGFALYSVDGKPDAILKGRDWVANENSNIGVAIHLSHMKPLFWDSTIDCHDSKAFKEYSKLKNK